MFSRNNPLAPVKVTDVGQTVMLEKKQKEEHLSLLYHRRMSEFSLFYCSVAVEFIISQQEKYVL